MYKVTLLLFLIMNFSSKLFAVSEDLVKGDKFYDQREVVDNAYHALALYEKHLDQFPNEPTALWRASMANYYVGHLIKNQDQRIDHYKKGVKQGELCAKETKSKMVECLFWLATNKTLLKKEKGILSLAFGISELIELFESAQAIDAAYAGSGPHRMLALLHYKAPGFLGGNVEKAYKYIREAITISPDEPLNQFLLIKFLHNDGDAAQAMEVGNKFLKIAQPDKFTFFESRSAFKNIKTYIDTNIVVDED